MKVCSLKSFTLIEIIVTIVIVSVLATMASMTYNRLMRLAVERRAIQELQVLNQANNIHRVKRSVFFGGDSNIVRTAADVNSGLRISLPDSGSTVYTYRALNNGAKYFAEASVTTYNFILRVYPGVLARNNPCCFAGQCLIADSCGLGGCGDGIISMFEECDDGNMTPGDGCHNCMREE